MAETAVVENGAPVSDEQPTWTREHLLGLEDQSAEEMHLVLDNAAGFKATGA